MAYDPREIWKKMLKYRGVTPYPKGQGKNEWGYDKDGKDVPLDPDVTKKLGSGWDTTEVWKTGSGGSYTDRYKQGEIPDWMQTAVDTFKSMAQEGLLDADEIAGLARHWINGEGIDPVWQNAFKAQPEWATQWLKDQFAEMGYSSDGGASSGGPGGGSSGDTDTQFFGSHGGDSDDELPAPVHELSGMLSPTNLSLQYKEGVGGPGGGGMSPMIGPGPYAVPEERANQLAFSSSDSTDMQGKAETLFGGGPAGTRGGSSASYSSPDVSNRPYKDPYLGPPQHDKGNAVPGIDGGPTKISQDNDLLPGSSGDHNGDTFGGFNYGDGNKNTDI